MPLTRAAQRIAEHAAAAAIARQKAEYVARIQRVQQAFAPPLSNRELSVGLGLQAPAQGSFGGSAVGRFLSDAPRNRRARPDSATRALLDALLAGTLLLAVRPPSAPGAPREVLVCDASDLTLLPRWWEVRDLSGRPVPERPSDDWEDASLWDLFDDGGAPEPGVEGGGLGASAGFTGLGGSGGTQRVAGFVVPRIGLGCMRLSTAGRPERSEAIAVVLAALDAGVRLLDTADSYGLDDGDLHHNEALLRDALAAWDGPRDEVLIASKVGLARPGGRWVPAGRPEQLLAAAERSVEALGGPISLLQLHAPHGKDVPFAEQLDALAQLAESGQAAHIGLCNVSLPQLDEALARMPIASVQLGLHRGSRAAFTGGVLARCRERRIPVLAHSPLGGHRAIEALRSDPALSSVARQLGATPEQVALAWLLAMDPELVALPGATRLASARSSIAALALHLPEPAVQQLEARRPWAKEARASIAAAAPPQIVLVAGPPAAGKTSRVAPMVAAGHARLNRDLLGGTLAGVDKQLRAALEAGGRRFVLDNTYPTRASRAPAVEAGQRAGIPVRLLWLEATVSDCYVNACLRMIERHGTLLDAEALRAASKDDPNMFPPAAVSSWFHRREEPAADEGFASIERIPFRRRWPQGHTGRALLLDYDGTLRRSTGPAPFPRHPAEVELLPGRVEALSAFAAAGWTLLGVSNQSGVARGDLTAEQAQACFQRTNELLGLSIDVRFDVHPAGRIDNWTRKPMPGLGVQHILQHHLDPARCTYVGDLPADAEFAAHCGFGYLDAAEFFEGLRWREVLDGARADGAPEHHDAPQNEDTPRPEGRRVSSD